MRILFLTDSYYPERAACAVRMKVLAETLLANGHDVRVLASDTSLTAAYQGYMAPDYVTFFPVAPLEEKTTINRLKNNFSGVVGALKASKGLGTFDIVLCTTPPLLLTLAATKIAKRAKAKLVLDVRDIWPDVAYEIGSFTPESIYGRLFSYIAKRAYKHAAMVTTVSSGKVAKIKDRVNEDYTKIDLVPNGLDVTFVQQEIDAAVVERYDLTRGPICAYVGNVGLAQGLGTVFELAKHRPDVRFLIFGDGAERKKLERGAREQGLVNVEFCGVLNSCGVFTVFKHATLSYAPLISSHLIDSVPTKIFESTGCGCPVLLGAVGDAVSVLNEIGLGVAAAPEDIEGLKKGLDTLVDHPFSEATRRSAAVGVAQRYSRQVAAEHLEQSLLQLVRRER